MSKHNKILDSWKTIGENTIPTYYVTKTSKYGVFTCSVTPCPQDYSNINDWDGYRFAERKCDIQIIHTKAKILKERAYGILQAYKALCMKYCILQDENSGTFLGDLKYQYELAQKEYEDVYLKYKYMRDDFSNYTTRITNRRKEVNAQIHK